MASNQFTSRGVRVGDRVFAVGTHRGSLLLLGALTVGEITTSRERVREITGYEPWDAAEHVIAAPGSGTKLVFANIVAPSITRELTYHSSDGLKRLLFRSRDALDQQTLRGVRRLTDTSGEALERLLTA